MTADRQEPRNGHQMCLLAEKGAENDGQKFQRAKKQAKVHDENNSKTMADRQHSSTLL